MNRIILDCTVSTLQIKNKATLQTGLSALHFTFNMPLIPFHVNVTTHAISLNCNVPSKVSLFKNFCAHHDSSCSTIALYREWILHSTYKFLPLKIWFHIEYLCSFCNQADTVHFILLCHCCCYVTEYLPQSWLVIRALLISLRHMYSPKDITG